MKCVKCGKTREPGETGWTPCVGHEQDQGLCPPCGKPFLERLRKKAPAPELPPGLENGDGWGEDL